MKEIGSEFWLDAKIREAKNVYEETLVLSGRTAIDLIIQDIQRVRRVSTAYLPAYCCDSMIAPFVRNGIKVVLYDMYFDGNLQYIIEENKSVDIFYVTNYFGYENTVGNDLIERFKAKGSIVIYDKTHSLFMDFDPTDALADYTFASIRKWMGVVCGAVVYKSFGVFNATLVDYPFLQSKIEAMQEKRRYIEGDSNIEKQSFLNKYGEFGHHLAEDFQGYKMDPLSVSIWKQSDKRSIREVRRENAIVLHKALSLQFIGRLTNHSCPVFVPVFFQKSKERNTVRKLLIEEQIYCPIHWPKNQNLTPDMEVNRMFETELSLICDQRYSVVDMERIAKVINNIY